MMKLWPFYPQGQRSVSLWYHNVLQGIWTYKSVRTPKLFKMDNSFCSCANAEWSSWLMRKNAVSAWTESQTLFCPARTASVRSALINGKMMDQAGIIFNKSSEKIYRPMILTNLRTIANIPLFLQEWAEPKLSNVPPASDCCQWLVGNFWFPHRGRHSWLHPQPGWWGWPPTQALTHSTMSQLEDEESDPYQVDLHVATQNVTFTEEEIFLP